MSVHKALRDARKAAGYSLAAAAKAIGITEPSLSRIETGRTKVSIQRLADFSVLYGLSGSALLDGEVLMRPSSIDVRKMEAVVELVAEIVQQLDATPSPSKLAGAVSGIYEREVNRLVDDPSAEFELERYRTDIETIFRD